MDMRELFVFAQIIIPNLVLSFSICMTWEEVFNSLCSSLFIMEEEKGMPTFSGSSEQFRDNTGWL